MTGKVICQIIRIFVFFRYLLGRLPECLLIAEKNEGKQVLSELTVFLRPDGIQLVSNYMEKEEK